MKKYPIADESSVELPFVRPNWPWWVVMWKAFVTLFIIAIWMMIFGWALLIGVLFGSSPPSFALLLIIFVNALLCVMPAWALWALSVSTWTERQDWAVKVGLCVGTLFCGILIFRAAQKAPYHGDPITAYIHDSLTLPFCLLTLGCFVWELWKQFKPRRQGI